MTRSFALRLFKQIFHSVRKHSSHQRWRIIWWRLVYIVLLHILKTWFTVHVVRNDKWTMNNIYIHVVSCVHGSVDLSICCPNKKEPAFQDMVSDPELSSILCVQKYFMHDLARAGSLLYVKNFYLFFKTKLLSLKDNDFLLEVLSGCSILYLWRGYGTKKLANSKFIHGISSFRMGYFLKNVKKIKWSIFNVFFLLF